MRLRKLILVGFLALALAPQALGQGCSMCYSSAEQQGQRAQQAMNTGILVLLFPTLLLFGGVLVTAIRRRNSHVDDSAE